MNDGIEKLREYAKNRWTEDKLTGEVMRVWYGRYTTGEEFDALADQIEREFHYSVDAAVEETEEFYRAKLAELDKRLMPQGMEWPRFEDGMQIACDDAPEDITAVCLALDGSCYSLHYDMPDDERMFIYDVSERVKRPVTEVLGADGLPIECCKASEIEELSARYENTCKMKKARWDDGQCTWGVICSACGEKHEHSFEYSFNFCPTCGAKVVES